MAVQGRNDDMHGDHATGGVTRDERGRFVGCGNRNGRPKKLKLPQPNSLAAALGLELHKDATIRVDGKSKTVRMYEAVAAKIIHTLMAGDAKTTLAILRHLPKLGALDTLNDVQDYQDSLTELNSGPGWTPELEAKYQALAASQGWSDDDPL